MGLEWRDYGGKVQAMYRPAPVRKVAKLARDMGGIYFQFGKIERDATGRLVASTHNFDHTKYVNSVDEGKQHIEAIFALEGLK